MDISRYRFFFSRGCNLIRIISDRLEPFDLYVAMECPKNTNIYFVDSTGHAIRHTNDDFMDDLIRDITCPQCNGKGTYIRILERDTVKKETCHRCQALGYIR